MEAEVTTLAFEPNNYEKHYLVRVARQIVLKSSILQPVIKTTLSTALPTIGSKQSSNKNHMVDSSRNLTDDLPQRPFYDYVCYFSRKAVRVLKHIVISQYTEPPTVIHANCDEPQRRSRLETPEEQNHVHLIPEKHNSSRTTIADEIAALQYKPTKNWESRMTRVQVVDNDDSQPPADDWRMKVQVLINSDHREMIAYQYRPTSNQYGTVT